ncbi:MAG TPA: hypothetical protein GX497_08540 [Bacillus bacterium]|nr:hypothetical protein [Bacillus sp. (in: firmicutes)]
MKRGKRPTRKQKIRMKTFGLNPLNRLIVKDCNDGFEVVHRETGTKWVISN